MGRRREQTGYPAVPARCFSGRYRHHAGL